MTKIKRLILGAALALMPVLGHAAANWPNTVSSDSTLFVAVNNCGTTLNSSITSGATTISVADTTCFPSVGYVTIDDEAIKYTGKTATTFTGCTRGADGTSAAAHPAGSVSYHSVIAIHHNQLKDELIAMSTYFFQGSQVHIDTATSRVGISTAAPVSPLTVVGTGVSNAFQVSTGTAASPSLYVTNAGVATAPTLSAGSITDTGLTNTRITFAGSGGLLQDDADMTFNGTTATITGASHTNLAVSGNLTNAALTSGRVTFAGSGSLLTDSSSFTFNGTTVTAPVVAVSSFNMTTNAGSGKYMVSDGSGNGTWTSVTAITGSGTSGQVAYFNGAGSITSGSGLTFDGTTFYTDDVNGTFIGMGRNRIINGAMRIDQRNSGAAVTVNSTTGKFPVDRWNGVGQSTDGVFTLQQSTTVVPTGFSHSVKATVTTADASIGATQNYTFDQNIEGRNVMDFGLGTAGAKQITLSFWVRSSVTGAFSGVLKNSAQNRSYPFSYTIDAADTWEFETVTLTGDTSGTWVTDAGLGLRIQFDLGSGTSQRGTANTWAGSDYNGVTGAVSLISTLNATWYLSGVQIEIGGGKTSYEHIPYGDELLRCKRYFFLNSTSAGATNSTTTGSWVIPFQVEMRATPTAAIFNGTNTVTDIYVATRNISSLGGFSGDKTGGYVDLTIASSTSGKFHLLLNGAISLDAEL